MTQETKAGEPVGEEGAIGLGQALSTQPGDQSALREVIARVLEERGQAQRIGNADYGTDPYYLLIGNAAQLRSGEWTPEALK